MSMHNDQICIKSYSKVVWFFIFVFIHNWWRIIEWLCIFVSILARFWQGWYLYLTTKDSGISNMTLHCIDICIWELGFRGLKDARYGFSLCTMGEQALQFHICHCQAFQSWQLHIVAFAWVWYIVDLFLCLCFQFLVFSFWLQYSYLKVHVSTSYMCSSSMRPQSFQLHCLSVFSFLTWDLSTFFYVFIKSETPKLFNSTV
jgi:hypothetical protein